jgi:hypothetical protein
MRKNQKCIYICARHPVFNQESVIQFENFSALDSSFLYKNLLANQIEVVTGLGSGIEIVYYLNVDDNNYVPSNFFPENSNIFFATGANMVYNMEVLDQKYFSLFENNILIHSNSIGISNKNINRIFDLLSIEDDSLVIGKSVNNKVPFIGFNKISRKLMIKLFEIDFDYEQFLLESGKSEMFLNTLEGSQLIENFEDFKKLYIELSKKESVSYCSQESHERFTHLFIEYRDLLR